MNFTGKFRIKSDLLEVNHSDDSSRFDSELNIRLKNENQELKRANELLREFAIRLARNQPESILKPSDDLSSN